MFLPLLEPARDKGAVGGRGSGKSHFFGGLLVEDSLAEPGVSGEGLRSVCIREVQKDLAQSSKALIESKLIEFKLGEADGFKVFRDCIETPGDGLIIFKGMRDYTAESIKSLEGYKRSWWEEAQSASKNSIKLLRPTMRAPGSQMWWSWNAVKATDPVDVMLRGPEKPTGAIVVTANWRDNPWFTAELEQERLDCLRRTPDDYQHVWEGEYLDRSQAQVFQNWRVDEFEAPQGTIFYFGSDWGYSIDPSVLVRAFIIGRTIFIDHEAYAVGCEIDKLPFLFAGTENEEIVNKNLPAYQALTRSERDEWKGVPGSTTAPIRADSQRPDTISYMKRHGFSRMVASTKGPGSVEDGIEFIKSYDVVIHPRCKNTIREFREYSYKVDKLTDEVTNVLADKENHVIDSVRYAVEQVRRKTRTTSRELGI